MDPWIWLVGYLVAFVLLQLLLIRYVLDGGSAGDSARDSSRERPAPGRAPRAASGRGAPRERAEEGMVTCQHCGTANQSEQSYTFCRACANPLR